MNLRQSGPFVGLGGMATTAFLYGYTAIVLPSLLMSVLLPLLWLVLLVLCLRWFTRRPYWALATPVAATAAWFGVLLAR